MDKEGLAFALGKAIEDLAGKFQGKPVDLKSLRELEGAVKLARNLPFSVNFYKTQNSYYDILKRHYPGLKAAAEDGGEDAKTWVNEFKELGSMLSVKVE